MTHFPSRLTLPRAQDLLALVCLSTGPDRNLDFLVFTATAPDEVPSHWHPTEGNRFTSSIDDVFRLFDAYLRGWEPGIGSREGRPRAYATQPSPLRPMPYVSKGRPNRALALLEVFLGSAVQVLEARAGADLDAARAARARDELRRARLPLGEKIRALRTQYGWTQDELAAKSGTSQAYVSGLETGASGRGSDSVLRALDLDPAEHLPPEDVGHALRRASSRDTRQPRRG